MKEAILLLLCAVALAHGFELKIDQKSRTCNCNPTEAQQICEANYGNDNVLIAHEKCDKFYMCSNGKPIAHSCPDNLLYNPYTEQCDWPYNVDCGDRPISDGSETDDADCDDDTGGGAGNDNDGGVDNNDNNNGTCNCNPDEAPSICAAEGSNGILIAHENCNQFYMCAEGKPVTFSCPPNLLYNPYNRECDWPQNIECGDRAIPEPDDDIGSDNEDNNNDNSGNDGSCNCNPDEAPSICAAAGSEGVLIAHENCNQFYICNYGKPLVASCPENLLYNPYTEQCDWPRNVDCEGRNIPEPESCSKCNESNESDNNNDLPPVGDDEENNSSDIDDLPPAGDDAGNDNQSNDNDGTCNCNPGEAPSICAAADSDDVLVAHENCNQFYKCDHGKPAVLTCPGNLLYNPYKEECDWPEDVDCGDRVIPDPDDGGNDNDVGDNDNGGNEIGGDGNDNVGAGNCDPSEAPTICAADDSEGVLVAHENCNQFYVCNGGKPIVLTCPGNLLFNPNTDQCDWPDNVDCGERVIPDLNESDNGNDGGDSDNDNDGNENGEGGNDNVGAGNCDPSEAPVICAADDSEGILIAHEKCNQFYICNEGKPIALTCPGNLLFNPNTDQCDWPDNVDCGERVIPDPEVNSDESGNDMDDLPPGGDDAGNDIGGGGNDNVGAGNCDPSEAPAICAADDSEGVLVAHENCNQFYVCNGGKPVVLSCPGNLLFNPNTDQCDWPENVDCGDRVIPDPNESDNGNDGGGSDNDNEGNDNGGGGNDNVGAGNCDPSEAPVICAVDDSEGILIAHENCNQFYICNGGKPIALACPGNLLFNPNTDQCDWPDNVDCGERVIPDPEVDSNESGSDMDDLPPGGDDTGNDIGEGGNDNVGAGNCDPSEAPSICAADDSEGVLVAHENCNKFYICNGGKPVVLACPGNLLFNPNTDQCDWPENVDCGDRVIPDPNESDNGNDGGGSDNDNEGNDNGGGGNDNVGAGNCDPSEAPVICAVDDSEGILIAHENCNQFYICNGGKPIALACPGNLLFNPNTDQCDWPDNVDCGERVIPDPEVDSNESGSDMDDLPPGGDDTGNDIGGGGNDNVGAGNCDPSEAPSICAADDSEGVLVAHENCNKFYICNGGKPVVLTCPGNLLFNPNTDQCDWPENVDCGDRVIPDPNESDNGNDGGGSDNDNDGNGNGGGGNDISGGGSDNVGAGNCDPSEAPAICAADDSEGVLVAHENCNQFYVCNGGKPIVLTCPGNLLFNPNTDQCDWPENVDCGDRVIPDPNESDNSNDGGGSDNDNDGNDNGEGGNDNVGAGNCDPSEAPVICAADDSEGILIAHENCNQFYICNEGKPVALTCPGNLLFNPNTDQCDWPDNVDCGERVIPDPEVDSNESGNDKEDLPPSGDDAGNDIGGGGNDNVGAGNCDPSEAPAICAADDSEGVLVAHENCNQFYVCNGGKPIVLTCPGNLLFNPNTDQCDWPENVDCGDRVIPDPNESDNGNDGGGSDNDNDGNDNGEGGNDNVGAGNCDPSEAPVICAADDSEGILIAHENCNQFYICNEGKPVALTCPGNLLFNPNTDQCDWPDNVDCGERVIPDPELDSNESGNDKEDLPPSGDDAGNDIGGGGNDNVGAGNCDPSEAPVICAADDSEGVLVAHENCNQFYVCNGGKPVVLSCPGNLLFNPNTDQCDWPENVDCGDRVIPDPDDNDNNNGNDGNNSSGNENNGSDNNGTCNCKPEEAPSVCAVDGSDGVLIAHENCNQFYKCDNGKPVILTCPGNLLYSPYTEQCDWSENVDCGDRVIPEDDNNDSGDDIDDLPPGGDDAGNNNSGSDSDDNLGNDSAASDNGGNDNNSDSDDGDCDDTAGNDNTCNCKPDEAPSICAVDGSNGVLIAHENCNQFYKCNNGQPIAFKCPSNLLYNPETEECDWPLNVECGDRVIPEPEDEDNNNNDNNDVSNESNDSGNIGSCNCNPEEAPVICAADSSDGVLIAHENCNQFYQCSFAKPVVLTCPSNLLYNPYKESCDWPDNVECGDRVIPEPDEDNNDNDGDSNNDDSDSGNININDDPSQAPAICAQSGSDGVLVAHENCNEFYMCSGGSPLALSCPGELLFNPINQQCDWSNNVDCGDRIVPDSNNDVCACNPRNAPMLCSRPNSDGMLVAHENCNQFFMCTGGVPVVRDCAANLHYNPDKEVCDWPQNVDCSSRMLYSSLNKHLGSRQTLRK